MSVHACLEIMDGPGSSLDVYSVLGKLWESLWRCSGIGRRTTLNNTHSSADLVNETLPSFGVASWLMLGLWRMLFASPHTLPVTDREGCLIDLMMVRGGRGGIVQQPNSPSQLSRDGGVWTEGNVFDVSFSNRYPLFSLLAVGGVTDHITSL